MPLAPIFKWQICSGIAEGPLYFQVAISNCNLRKSYWQSCQVYMGRVTTGWYSGQKPISTCGESRKGRGGSPQPPPPNPPIDGVLSWSRNKLNSTPGLYLCLHSRWEVSLCPATTPSLEAALHSLWSLSPTSTFCTSRINNIVNYFSHIFFSPGQHILNV